MISLCGEERSEIRLARLGGKSSQLTIFQAEKGDHVASQLKSGGWCFSLSRGAKAKKWEGKNRVDA